MCRGDAVLTLACVLLAAGSSTQVGVLVVPFCVVLAWMMGQPLDLNLFEFEALVLFISVLLAAVVVQVRWDVCVVSSCTVQPCLLRAMLPMHVEINAADEGCSHFCCHPRSCEHHNVRMGKICGFAQLPVQADMYSPYTD